jgi:hypothetical protein
MEVLTLKEDYCYDNEQRYSHKIDNTEELTDWQNSLSSAIIRYSYGSKGYGGYGHSINFAPHGIILYTEKEKVFIGLTPFGFRLGIWKGKQLGSERLFYWTDISYLLKKYIKKHRLENFPNIDQYDLSGKNRFKDALYIEETDIPNK